MARRWNDIDWTAEPPSPEDAEASRARLRWVRTPISFPALDQFLSEVDKTHVNGGHVLGRWAASGYDDAMSWFMARNRFGEYGLFEHFFDDRDVQIGLQSLGIQGRARELANLLQHDWSGGLTLDGQLASIIVHGGAYKQFDGSAREAKKLATTVADLLTEQRYEDIHLHTTYAKWSPWFSGIWDRTYVITDKQRAEITVLCVTDVD